MSFTKFILKQIMWWCGVPSASRELIIPMLYKNEPSSYIRSESDWRNLKSLFCVAMIHRAYDVFTTSILAVCFKNITSLCALSRTQLENIALTEHVLKNPEDLKRVFKDNKDKFGEFKVTSKSLGSERAVFGKVFGHLSKRTHPLSAGLKMAFGRMFILNYREMKWEPTISIKNHHAGLEVEEIPEAINIIVSDFGRIKSNLDKIANFEINYQISDAAEVHPEGSGKQPPNPPVLSFKKAM